MGMIVVYVLSALVAAYACWGLMLLVLQPRFVYQPSREISFTPAELGLDFEDASFRTEDGLVLHGWWLPRREAVYTVLFCHGNGGNVMHRLDSLKMLGDLGVNCFIFDYRGYGRSEGKPTEKGTYADARAAYNWLIREKGVSPQQIILLGRSLGGSIAAQLAGEVELRSLVIESAFTSFVAIGQKYYPYLPVRWFAMFRYDTAEAIRRVRCPILFIYSRDDRTVAFEFGLELYELAGEPKQFVEVTGGHNDYFLVSASAYQEAWRRWLESLDRLEARPAEARRAV